MYAIFGGSMILKLLLGFPFMVVLLGSIIFYIMLYMLIESIL